MIRTLSLCAFAMSLAATTTHADYRVNYGALTCDGARALIQFAAARGEATPVFPVPPAGIDFGLSVKPRVDGNVCTLSDGREIKVKMGEEQPRAYGACGGARDAFMSLWVGERKVISRRYVTDSCGWKAHRDVMVIDGDSLTMCRSSPTGPGADAASAADYECEDATAQLADAEFDPLEYPGANAAREQLGTMTVPFAEDAAFCDRFVTYDRTGPSIGDHAFDVASATDAYHHPASMQIAPTERYNVSREHPFTVGRLRSPNFDEVQPRFEDLVDPSARFWPVAFSTDRFDFDNDGAAETVLRFSGRSGGFDGDIFKIADDEYDKTFANGIATLEAAMDKPSPRSVAMFLAKFDLTEYSGRFDALTPGYSDRHTYQQVIRANDETLMFATSVNRRKRPTAAVYRPRPGGEAEPVCVFQRVEENY